AGVLLRRGLSPAVPRQEPGRVLPGARDRRDASRRPVAHAAGVRQVAPAMARAWLVRHGETEWARLGRHTGRTDVPPTELAQSQAVAVGRKLAGHAFASVLVSPRARAMDTARIAGLGASVLIDADLAEWDYGDDEGLTTAE